jgi:hypothetical protein
MTMFHTHALKEIVGEIAFVAAAVLPEIFAKAFLVAQFEVAFKP